MALRTTVQTDANRPPDETGTTNTGIYNEQKMQGIHHRKNIARIHPQAGVPQGGILPHYYMHCTQLTSRQL